MDALSLSEALVTVFLCAAVFVLSGVVLLGAGPFPDGKAGPGQRQRGGRSAAGPGRYDGAGEAHGVGDAMARMVVGAEGPAARGVLGASRAAHFRATDSSVHALPGPSGSPASVLGCVSSATERNPPGAPPLAHGSFASPVAAEPAEQLAVARRRTSHACGPGALDRLDAFLSLFPGHPVDDAAKFFCARDGDVEAAARMYRAAVAWRSAALPVPLAEVQSELRKGAFYVRGADKSGRAVLYWRTALSTPWDRDIELVTRAVIFVLEVALRLNRSADGKVVLLLDRTGASRRNQDVEVLRALAGTLSKYYPETLATALVFPSGWVFRSVWAIVRLFLDPATAGKVKALASAEALQDDVPPHVLPVSLGGTDRWTFSAAELYGLEPMPENWVEDSYAKWAAGEK